MTAHDIPTIKGKRWQIDIDANCEGESMQWIGGESPGKKPAVWFPVRGVIVLKGIGVILWGGDSHGFYQNLQKFKKFWDQKKNKENTSPENLNAGW